MVKNTSISHTNFHTPGGQGVGKTWSIARQERIKGPGSRGSTFAPLYTSARSGTNSSHWSALSGAILSQS